MPNLIEQDLTALQKMFLRIGIIRVPQELKLKQEQYTEVQSILNGVWEINIHHDKSESDREMYAVLFTNLEKMDNYVSCNSNMDEAFADVLNHIWPLLKSTQQLAILKVLQNGDI